MGIGGGRTDCLWLHTEANRGRDVGHDKRRHWIRGQVLGPTNGEHIRMGLRGNDNRGITISNRINMVNNKQQTAVDWFIKQLQSNIDIRWRGTNIIELGEQAKEMFEEQIEKAYDDAIMKGRQEDGEQYYQQTYGGGEK